MKSISNAIVSFFELLEAEGRSFRKSSISMVENMLVVFFALALMFVGVIVALFSFYIWLSWYIGRVGGSAVIAVLLLASGYYLYVKARSLASRGALFFEKTKPDDATGSERQKGRNSDAR